MNLQLPKPKQPLFTNENQTVGGASPYAKKPMAQNMVKPDHKKESTQIAYYISIDMELQEGTTLSEEDKKNIKCRVKWNAVRKAYAEFIGKPYTIAPLYHNKTNKVKNINTTAKTNTTTNTTAKANTSTNTTAKTNTNDTSNYTRTQKQTGGKAVTNRYTRKRKT
jgi:hypothetical protein